MIKSPARRTVTATVTAKSWDESRYDDTLAQAESTQTYEGDLQGESSSRLLIAYTGGDPAEPKTLVGDYVGMERFTGTLDGRAGSFVVEFRGRHEDAVARTKGHVVPGSATGDLAGLHGDVDAAADAMTYQLTLTYAFEPPAGVH